ncbi:MAG: phenylalanine--tRNA ligase subunit beta [Ardenticatenaceae bacterium]|nr:phenylalanine--tRNA ligase subunit beta [Ardenticatenaceae bacterium]
MLVPISWLKEYVDINMSVEELASMLTIAGLEVESIDYLGIPGGNDKNRLVWDREKIVIGHIRKVEQHPDADRLVLATVDYGGDEYEVTVTGAPNLFQYVGQGDISGLKLYSPFAMEGAELYDGHKEGQVKAKLKGRPLRGIYNRCMLCSEKELGISDEHEGIMILDGDQTPGTPVQDVLGDAVLSIDIIPNIARCASIVGVAREVAALTGQKVHYPSYELVQEGPSVADKVVITTENPELNPRFVAIVIKGVAQKTSPQWMQRRLKLAGQRPINVVVDISNYVMLEMGEPNHTFDYDFLRRRADQYNGSDGPIRIVTRLPHEGEKVTTLDGVNREMPATTILVTDPAGALSIGGIMGGEESEISDSTTSVLLEAASWNFINIRRSATLLKLNSEAGFRFSRGVHPSQSILGAKRAAELLRQLAGGTVAQGIIDYYPNPAQPAVLQLTEAEVQRIGGISPSLTEIQKMLESLEFGVENKGDHLMVTSPDHRLDIEFTNDLVEEVCRMYGYDQLPAKEMSDTLPPQRSNEKLEKEERIKDILVQLGMQEIITYRLTTPERENKLLPAATGITPDDRPYVTLANPITVDRVTMRHSLLASALETAAANSRFNEYIALFEIGKIYLASEEGDLPDELTRLSLVLTGPRLQVYWQNNGQPDGMDFFDLKGIIEALLADLHVEGLNFEAVTHPTYRPGRTARLLLGEQQLGLLGELHPLVVKGFDIRTDQPVLAAELDLDLLSGQIPPWHHVEPISSYPAVHEDLALVVDKTVPAAQVEAQIRQAGGFLLKDVAMFDIYEGLQIPAGKKSLAYHLTFQSPSKTLQDKDVKKQRQRILQQLERQLGARLRE